MPTYLPPVGIGEVMRGFGLGRVVASRSDSYREGQLVRGLVGWQEWVVASEAAPLLAVRDIPGVSPSAHLGVLGVTGPTAWVGMRDIGRPQRGETVVVSAAAGGVGSVAEGVDVDFENVGGQIMDAVFARLNLRARVVLCGLISGYNATDPPPGPRSFPNLLIQRVLLQGFIVLDHMDRMGEAVAELSGWIREGKLEPLETVVDGFEQLPAAINMLFDGANIGKLVVRVAD